MSKILKDGFKAMRRGDVGRLRQLRDENHGSAISFVIGMFIIIVIAVNLLPTVADQALTAQENTSVASFGGVVAMIGILVLLFVILPLVILAKAAS